LPWLKREGCSKATDKDDCIIDNKSAGTISYDADGSGKKAAVVITTIDKGTLLDVDSFLII
jgi:hypothetical protein